MWLTVEHTTRFDYDAPVVEAHTELRLKPAHRCGQRCSAFGMEMEPRGNGDGQDGASHAWVDVYDETRGWLSLDPTHDTEQTERYIRVGLGRDYADVPPTRGVYRGAAAESLDVAVVVSAL